MKKYFSKGLIFVGGAFLGYSLNKCLTNFDLISADGATTIPRYLPIPLPNYQLPANSDIKIFRNFIISYNRRTRNPDWVLEWLTPSLVGLPHEKPDFRKDLSFEYDETEPPQFRVIPNDYNGSGFDRGHLAAAANYKNDEDDCRRSFAMSNICPQVGENFNRGIWNKLEMYTRALVRRSDYVFVCTGPLYLPRAEGTKKFVHYEVIGRMDVAVPTHFFKILLVKEQGQNSFKLYSYVMPNEPIRGSDDFQNFYCPLADIERAAGCFIFSELLKSLRFTQINADRIS